MPAERANGRLSPALPLALGALATAGAVLALLAVPQPALEAWLAATMLWAGLPIGALGFVMMMRLIAGIWKAELMVAMEGAALLLPLAMLAFVPLGLGLGELFHWVGEAQETAFRQAYLADGFMLARTAGGLALLGVLALLAVFRIGPVVAVAAVGLIAYPLVAGMLGVDWLMTLDAHFHSSIFGLYVLSMQMCFALMCAALVSLGLGPARRRPEVVGGLMLASLLVWAYMAFMQYFIIWSGDLPPGVRWYLARSGGGWTALLWAMALLHAVPGFLLLLVPVLKGPRMLMALAATVIVGKALEMAWLVLPAGHGAEAPVLAAALFALATIGLGGLFGGALMLAVRAREHRRPEHEPHGELM